MNIKIRCMTQYSGEQFHQIKRYCTIKITSASRSRRIDMHTIYMFVNEKVENLLMGNNVTFPTLEMSKLQIVVNNFKNT